ncbi:MAG: M14 family zinc carboxypeptidase [Phormidesmis sp.]
MTALPNCAQLLSLETNVSALDVEWTDIKRIDSLILESKTLGTQVEEIGISGEGRPLYGVTVGDRTAARTIGIIAGCHAGEIIGPLAAISTIQHLANQPIPGIKFKIVPTVDPDFLHKNAKALPANPTLQDLLGKGAQQTRDLEGHFTTDTYPECVAVRRWLQQLDRVDAYFSLHSSGLIAPGLFFYIGSGANPGCAADVVRRVAAAVPDYIPLLPYDPTGVASAFLSPGFFEIPVSDAKELNLVKPSNSLSFVAQHFQPQFIGVSEMPLAICSALDNAPLSRIDRCNCEFRQTGRIDHSFIEVDLHTQLSIMRTFIGSVAQFVALRKES